MLFPSAPLFILPFGSFAGALIISMILTILISKFNVKGSKLALIGLAIGAICTAIVQYMLIRNPLDANTALVWLTGRDRKSTRLNSSHVSISYAVFCLKKQISK